jgi:hypothetical protein
MGSEECRPSRTGQIAQWPSKLVGTLTTTYFIRVARYWPRGGMVAYHVEIDFRRAVPHRLPPQLRRPRIGCATVTTVWLPATCRNIEETAELIL